MKLKICAQLKATLALAYHNSNCSHSGDATKTSFYGALYPNQNGGNSDDLR